MGVFDISNIEPILTDEDCKVWKDVKPQNSLEKKLSAVRYNIKVRPSTPLAKRHALKIMPNIVLSSRLQHLSLLNLVSHRHLCLSQLKRHHQRVLMSKD